VTGGKRLSPPPVPRVVRGDDVDFSQRSAENGAIKKVSAQLFAAPRFAGFDPQLH
jgi:hypothetical protein